MPRVPRVGQVGRTHTLSPGSIVGERFRVLHKLASGGMGEVWAGEHRDLKFRVALKVLKEEVLGNDEVVARFSREALLLGQVTSDHVARVLDFFPDGKQGPVLVMEFVDGKSLAEVLSTRRLTVEETVDLGIDIASALCELHAANVVHRDVKPANILLRLLPDGARRAVFVDLGVSRQVAEADEEALTEITTMGRAVGTIEYMAPEQILCSKRALASADLYALGAVLFRAVTGHNVFGALRGMELVRVKLSAPPPPLVTGRRDRVAQGLEAAVARALAPTPDNRYESADELLADLSLLRDVARRARVTRAPTLSLGAAPTAPPPPRPPPLPLPARAHAMRSWIMAATVAGIASAALVGAWGAWAWGARSSTRPAVTPAVPEHCALTALSTEAGGKGRFTVTCESP
jgi:serine/threonine-protein kinase